MKGKKGGLSPAARELVDDQVLGVAPHHADDVAAVLEEPIVKGPSRYPGPSK